MRRTVFALFIIGGSACWGQAQSDAAGAANKIDRATAYYHYAMAHMYAEKAAASGGPNREYVNKAIEEYKAAIKADPQMPMLRDELSDIEAGRLVRFRPPLHF